MWVTTIHPLFIILLLIVAVIITAVATATMVKDYYEKKIQNGLDKMLEDILPDIEIPVSRKRRNVKVNVRRPGKYAIKGRRK